MKKLMKKYLEIHDLKVEVTRKKVKNLNLRVYPSEGRVSLSCPLRTDDYVIKSFLTNKKNWIDKQLKKGESLKRRVIPEFVSGDKIFLWGEEMELLVQTVFHNEFVKMDEKNRIVLYVREGRTRADREKILSEWYRQALKNKIPGLIKKWEPEMGVKVSEFGVKKMKTRWGTCNIREARIWLNLELAKLKPDCLEYIVVHEMVHLLERLHNKRFYNYMSQFLPGWQETDKLLKQHRF